jgi:molybdenum cofactor cytidylyltransferase
VPDLNAAIVRRLVDAVTPDTLRQAHFAGRPGHPVVIGREHWAPLRAALTGDTGARPYLVAHRVTAVPCDDLGTGLDVDEPSTE